MNNWNLLFRRTHLYLGMALLPWMLLYAVSTFTFSHREWFKVFRAADPQWTQIWEKDYALAMPTAANDPAALRATAQRLLDDQQLSGAFAVRRTGSRLNINVQNFFHPRRLTYDFTTKKLRAEEKSFAWLEVLVRLHERTGYGTGGWLNNLWAFAVDVYCVTTLVWIATGIYLWWKLSATRRWGFVALGGGCATLLVLAFTL
ncbi:MAG: hypothetical protein RLZZ15_3401 [Verrucomicrobiota bacterium]|jgi:hypothetical protein